jgi:hypothetical protein
MLQAPLKPRWRQWESLCLKIAFKQRIQLKVIAAALEKSVTSVSKKIRTLGLRKENSKPGRLKGDNYASHWADRIPLDFEKMATIVSRHAPLKHSQKMKLTLRTGCWTTAAPPLLQKKASQTHPNTTSYSYSLSLAPAKDRSLPSFNSEKLSKDPLYISLRHIEKWALSHGFHQVKHVLQEQGLAYWKEGKYFSKAQLLVYVNGIRLEKKLQPLQLCEEETEA